MHCACCFRENVSLFITTCDACYTAEPSAAMQCRACIDARRRVNNHLVCTKCSAPTKIVTAYRYSGMASKALNEVFKKEQRANNRPGELAQYVVGSWLIDCLLLHFLDFSTLHVLLHHTCIALILLELRGQATFSYGRPFITHCTEGYVILHFFYVLFFGVYFVSLIILPFLPFVAWIHALLPLIAYPLALFHAFVIFYFVVLIVRHTKNSVAEAIDACKRLYDDCFTPRSRAFAAGDNSGEQYLI